MAPNTGDLGRDVFQVPIFKFLIPFSVYFPGFRCTYCFCKMPYALLPSDGDVGGGGDTLRASVSRNDVNGESLEVLIR